MHVFCRKRIKYKRRKERKVNIFYGCTITKNTSCFSSAPLTIIASEKVREICNSQKEQFKVNNLEIEVPTENLHKYNGDNLAFQPCEQLSCCFFVYV